MAIRLWLWLCWRCLLVQAHCESISGRDAVLANKLEQEAIAAKERLELYKLRQRVSLLP